MSDLQQSRTTPTTARLSLEETGLDPVLNLCRPSAQRSVMQSLSLEPPRILLAATLRWPLAARLAIALRAQGCSVQAWCPKGHPLEYTQAVQGIHRCASWAPLQTLQSAIAASTPDFIIPCDDNAVTQLHRLHAHHDDSPAGASLRALIEYSLGSPASCALATERGELMRRAAAAGVRVPATATIASKRDLDDWIERQGFPLVLKVDGSWGGLGVTIATNRQQAHAALRSAMRPPLTRALSQWLLRRDASQLRRHFNSARPAVVAQTFIDGRPANRAVACWQGEVLAGISVVALQTHDTTGPATVVKVIDNPEMTDAARRLVRTLGLSGLCGLDFVIEWSSGAAHMIEVNPRATPISHLPLGTGQNLLAALHARLRGEPQPVSVSTIPEGLIAMFPGEWRRDSQSPYLRSAFHDVPWAETALVRDCVQPLWESRGLIARLRAQMAGKRRPALAVWPPPGAGPLG